MPFVEFPAYAIVVIVTLFAVRNARTPLAEAFPAGGVGIEPAGEGAGLNVTLEDTAGVSMGEKSRDGTALVGVVTGDVAEDSSVGVGAGTGLGDPEGAKADRMSKAG